MNFRDNELMSRLILLGELILVTLISYIAYTILPHGNGNFVGMLVITACAFVFLFLILRSRQRRVMRQSLLEVAKTIKRLEENLGEEIASSGQSSALREFYSEIEGLRLNLLSRETMRQDTLRMVSSIATNMELEQMLQTIMPEINIATNSNCSAFYLVGQTGERLEIKHSIGFSKNLYGEFDLKLGEGIVGNIGVKTGITVLNDIPDDTVYVVRSFLGKIKPKSMMSVPVVNQEQLLGVLVLASVYSYTPERVETMELLKHYLGVAVFNGLSYERNKRLTNELKFQNKLIQELNDDLELKVQERTTFLNDTIDSIKDYAIYALDPDGIILAWNKGAENIMGYTLGEVLGEHVEFIYPPELVRTNAIRDRLDNALRNGSYVESGWRVKKDGTRYYAEINLFARYGKNGEIIGFTNVMRDITALKSVESLLAQEKAFSAALMEQSCEAVLLLDDDLMIINTNGKAAELFGTSKVAGYQFIKYFSDEQKLRESLQEIIRQKTSVKTAAKLKGDGRAVTVAASVLSYAVGNKTEDTTMLLVRLERYN